jgi:hypothetical protein
MYYPIHMYFTSLCVFIVENIFDIKSVGLDICCFGILSIVANLRLAEIYINIK